MFRSQDRRFRRTRFSSAIGALAVGILAGSIACGSLSSSSLSVTPTTGVVLRAETLTSGRGCGKDPTQLYKYAVLVFEYSGGPADSPTSYGSVLTSNVFDCFTDGVFISLRPSSVNTGFRLEVFGYNEASYEASRSSIDTAGSTPSSQTLGALPQLLRETAPTWSTECSVIQQENVQALVSCDPLSAGLAGVGGTSDVTTITLDTTRFLLPDGREAECATSPPPAPIVDAGDDADIDASDDPSDAGDDADADIDTSDPPPSPPASLTFSAVRIRPRSGTTIVGPTVDLTCPARFVARVGPDPAHYELDVGLLDAHGNLLDPAAMLVCSVTSRTGEASSAVCR